MKRPVLVLGGAGFIGSNLVRFFLENNYQVTVIDGLLKETGGRKSNLDKLLDRINFIDKPIEKTENLEEYIKKVDIIVDCMGWTSHRLALENPEYDLRLNVVSHLTLIRALKNHPGKTIFYLGSRGQYGKPEAKIIDENTPTKPLDIQGIHKLTAESYFRVYSKLYSLHVISLRIPNCYGPNQPIKGDDIGLIGSFIISALNNRAIKVFGKTRKRSVIYVEDLCWVILKLADKLDKGFTVYNIPGDQVNLEYLAKTIVAVTEQGNYSVEELPDHLAKIDIGDIPMNDELLFSKIGKTCSTELVLGLTPTVEYFKTNL